MQFKKAIDFILNRLVNELPQHLSYHNMHHAWDVYTAAAMIGKQEGISVMDTKLLLTAASYHDAGFLKAAVGHEEESCRIAANTLPAFGYKSAEIEKICGLIRATKIPQFPKNHLEETLADADLDYLGRDDFFSTGHLLFNEMLLSGVVNNEEEWNRVQVRFMESHHYFTQTSVNLRSAKKEQHFKQVKAKLNT